MERASLKTKRPWRRGHEFPSDERGALFFFSQPRPRQKNQTPQQKELKEIDRDKASGVTVALKGGSLKKLTGYVEGEIENGKRERNGKRQKRKMGGRPLGVNECSLPRAIHRKRTLLSTGPKDTPYEEGFFVVDIELGTFFFCRRGRAAFYFPTSREKRERDREGERKERPAKKLKIKHSSSPPLFPTLDDKNPPSPAHKSQTTNTPSCLPR